MKPAAYVLLDFSAMQHNFSVVRQHAPQAKIIAVIKGNGYGHGLLRVAESLPKADAFAVARVDEGIRLRKAGVTKKIIVLEGFTFEDELSALINFQLDVLVHSPHQIAFLLRREEKKQLSVWLKLDTGMNRLGFKIAEFTQAYADLMRCPVLKKPINLMTHLASADDKNDPKTQAQIRLFTDTIGSLPGERSIANSAGILGWQDAITDWVRPGVMLYGISPFADVTAQQLNLKPVMSLHSRLIAVKRIAKHETVGYAGSWVAPYDTVLGVISIGYADGYPRTAKSGTPVLVNGQRVALIGRVSMDMITVDLQSQPHAKPGDPVVLWGESLPVEEIALLSQTIPYTLVCGITQRVRQFDSSWLT